MKFRCDLREVLVDRVNSGSLLKGDLKVWCSETRNGAKNLLKLKYVACIMILFHLLLYFRLMSFYELWEIF